MADTESSRPDMSRRERNRLAQRRHRMRIRELNEQQRNAALQNSLFDKLAPVQSGLSTDDQPPWTVEPGTIDMDGLALCNSFGFDQTDLMSGNPLEAEGCSAIPGRELVPPNSSTFDSVSIPLSETSSMATLSTSTASGISSVDTISPEVEFQSASTSSLQQRRRKPYCEVFHGGIAAGSTPLHMLCGTGSCEQVARMLATGANAQARDQFGMTPLHVAARQGNTGAITALLDGGVSVDARDKQGMTALHHASWCGYDEAIEVLLRGGASSDAAVIPEESA